MIELIVWMIGFGFGAILTLVSGTAIVQILNS